jgi:hypothetical protein
MGLHTGAVTRTALISLLVLWAGSPVSADALSLADALRALADVRGLSLVTCDLPPDAPPYTGEIGEVLPTLTAIAEECGVETAVWRGIIIARRGRPGTLRERLSAAVTGRAHDLLFRPPDSRREWEPGWREIVVEYAKRLARGDQSPETQALANDAAMWMVAQALDEVFQWDEANRAGRYWLHVVPRDAPAGAGPAPKAEGLLLYRLKPTSDSPGHAEFIAIKDASSDWWAEEAARQRPTVSRDELVQGYIAKAIETHSIALAPGAGLITVEAAGPSADVAQAVGAQIGGRVVWDPDRGQRVTVCLRAARAEDALLALAGVTGRYPWKLNDGVRLADPGQANEALLAALPLADWVTCASTVEERKVAAMEWVLVLWRQLPERDADALRAGWVRMAALSQTARRLLSEYIRTWLIANPLPAALWGLPVGDESPSFGLQDCSAEMFPHLKLLLPCREERVGDGAYLELKTLRDGKPPEWKVRPRPGEPTLP